ncbi:MAG TPA: HisS family protein, partial [Patescibacteria group bacterium]|nr:HisS family protein [Patescibacteria group bacterium]
MQDKKIFKPRPVSGFPEWLPEVRIVEQQWLDHIRRVFESYGFCSVETPSIEELEVLHAKGEVDKEIYVLERLHKEEGDKEARLALHFDQTVPLARYVAQHWDKLVFPFKRYQMQRVWRGERPQAGRFREFTQCDIDVINNDTLPLHFDAEMPAIIWEVLNGLPGMEKQRIQIRISNRTILINLFEALGFTDIPAALRIIDKKDKISEFDVKAQLKAQAGMTDEHWKLFSNLLLHQRSSLTTSLFVALEQLEGWAAQSDPLIKSKDALLKMRKGVEDLDSVLTQIKNSLPHNSISVDAIVMDLGIVRGLDYYT